MFSITGGMKHCQKKNVLTTLHWKCEILKSRKDNLLGNIDNQDKILEEKLSKNKINQ